jgi:hypothetical protein
MKKLNKVAVLFASPLLPPRSLRLRSEGDRQLAQCRRFTWCGRTAPTNCAGVMPTGRRPRRTRVRRRHQAAAAPAPAPAPRRLLPPVRRRPRVARGAGSALAGSCARQLPPRRSRQREGHLRRRRVLRRRQVGAEARSQGQAGRPGQQDQGHQPRSDHRRRPHRQRRFRRLQPEAVGAPCRSRQGLSGRARASRRTASTPKARARSSPVADNKTKPKAGEEPPRRDRGRRYPRQEVIAGPSGLREAAAHAGRPKTPPGGVSRLRHLSAAQRMRPHSRCMSNVDAQELAKFSDLAHRWWDPTASSARCTRSTRCGWTGSTLAACGQAVLDVGCGGGILAESMAQRGADVTGIDLATKPLGVARLHALEAGVPNLDYREIASAEALAAERPAAASTSSPAWRCSSTCPTRRRPCGLRRAGQAGRLGVLLDHQPQPEVLPVRHRRCRVRAEAAARARTSTRASSARANWRAGAATPAWTCRHAGHGTTR